MLFMLVESNSFNQLGKYFYYLLMFISTFILFFYYLRKFILNEPVELIVNCVV